MLAWATCYLNATLAHTAWRKQLTVPAYFFLSFPSQLQASLLSDSQSSRPAFISQAAADTIVYCVMLPFQVRMAACAALVAFVQSAGASYCSTNSGYLAAGVAIHMDDGDAQVAEAACQVSGAIVDTT